VSREKPADCARHGEEIESLFFEGKSRKALCCVTNSLLNGGDRNRKDSVIKTVADSQKEDTEKRGKGLRNSMFRRNRFLAGSSWRLKKKSRSVRGHYMSNRGLISRQEIILENRGLAYAEHQGGVIWVAKR